MSLTSGRNLLRPENITQAHKWLRKLKISRPKEKEPGISNPCPALMVTSPKCFGLSLYLFVDVVEGVALVAGGVVVDSLGLQPVTNAPITSPNRTIRVYVRFIGGATFDQFHKNASIFFELYSFFLQNANVYFTLRGCLFGGNQQFEIICQIRETQPRHPALLPSEQLPRTPQLQIRFRYLESVLRLFQSLQPPK